MSVRFMAGRKEKLLFGRKEKKMLELIFQGMDERISAFLGVMAA